MNYAALQTALAFVIGASVGALTAVSCDEEGPASDRALMAALATTARETGGRFGPGARPLHDAAPHRLVARVEILIAPPSGAARRLELERVVDRDADGRFRVVDRRTLHTPEAATPRYDEGREGVFDGGRFATRRRHGPWIARDLLERGHERLLREAHDLTPAALAGFADYLRWEEDPESDEELAGVAVRWANASLDPRVAPRALDAEALAALRDHTAHWPAWIAATHRPTRVSGRVARSKSTGEVVAAALEVSGDAIVDGVPADFAISVGQRVEPLPAKASFDLPDDVLPDARERTWRMIEAVLGDALEPIYVRR